MTTPGPDPLIRVVRGQPAAEELAAVVAAIAAVHARAVGTAAPARTSAASRLGWASKAALMRAPIGAGPGAWKASALPR